MGVLVLFLFLVELFPSWYNKENRMDFLAKGRNPA